MPIPWYLWIGPMIVCWINFYFVMKHGDNTDLDGRMGLTDLIIPILVSFLPLFNIVLSLCWTIVVLCWAIRGLHNNLYAALERKQKHLDNRRKGIHTVYIDGEAIEVTQNDIWGVI